MLEARSRLGRLFMYSKDTAFAAQENFTTEALAMAIGKEPSPIVEALCGLDPVKADRLGIGRGSVRPSTQVALPHGGWLDLVLEISDQRGLVTGEVWIEVKIDAPESGLQLDAYEVQSRVVPHPVWLLTLARDVVRTTITNLSWNELYQSAAGHESWEDLRAFLKEQMVASDALGPISDREAASLEPAYELIAKVSEVLRVVHHGLVDLSPEPWATKLRWSAEGAFLNFVGANFRSTGEIVGIGGPVTYGLVSEGGTAYWLVALRQGAATRSTAEVSRVTAERAGDAREAARSSLGSHWERPISGPTVVATRTRAATLDSHHAVVAWVNGRLHELAESGVLGILMEPLALTTTSELLDLGPTLG